MINKQYNKELMIDKQKKMLWWIKNNSLFLNNTLQQNMEIIENILQLKF